MKNRDLFTLHQGLLSCGDLKGVRFAVAVARNMRRLVGELEDLTKAIQQSPEYQEYDLNRVELCKNYAMKDGDGNPVMRGTEYVISDMSGFEFDLQPIRETFAVVIAEHDAKVAEYNAHLDDENETFVPYKISEDVLPKDITPAQLTSIWWIIEDE